MLSARKRLYNVHGVGINLSWWKRSWWWRCWSWWWWSWGYFARKGWKDGSGPTVEPPMSCSMHLWSPTNPSMLISHSVSYHTLAMVIIRRRVQCTAKEPFAEQCNIGIFCTMYRSVWYNSVQHRWWNIQNVYYTSQSGTQSSRRTGEIYREEVGRDWSALTRSGCKLVVIFCTSVTIGLATQRIAI